MRSLTKYLPVFLIALSFFGCKFSDDSESDSEESESDLAVEANELADVLPVELQLISPTLTTGSGIDIASVKKKSAKEADTELFLTSSEQTFAEKVEGILNIMTSDDPDDCEPNLNFEELTAPSCYEQLVLADGAGTLSTSSLITIPTTLDATEVDGGSSTVRHVKAQGSGIVNASLDDVPCSIAVSEYFVARSAQAFDRAQSFLAAMRCAARQQGKAQIPPPSGSLDLSDVLTSAWNADTYTIKQALITSEHLTTQEDPVFRTTLSLTYKREGVDQNLIIDVRNAPVVTAESRAHSGHLLVYEDQIEDEDTNAFISTMSFARSEDEFTIFIKDGLLQETMNPVDLLDEDTGLLQFSSAVELSDLGEGALLNPSSMFLTIDTTTGTGQITLLESPSLAEDIITSGFSLNTKVKNEAVIGCAIVGHSYPFLQSNGSDQEGLNILGKHCLMNQTITGGDSYTGTVADFSTDLPKYVQMQCFRQSKTDQSWSETSSNLKWVVADECGYGTADEDDTNLSSTSTGKDAVDFPKIPSEHGLTFKPNSAGYDLTR